MPMLEVIHALPGGLGVAEKRAFSLAARQVFQDVLGTPPGRLRLIYLQIDPEDTIEGLIRGPGAADAVTPPGEAQREQE